MSNQVLFETAEHTAVITLNRPERRNAFNPEVLIELYNALDEVRSNDAITGGLEIALHCDFLIASERAFFADTHLQLFYDYFMNLFLLDRQCKI